MIIQDRPATKYHGNFFILTMMVLLVLTMMTAGCGSDDKSAPGQGNSGQDIALTDVDQCGIVIDDSAWQVFKDISQRQQAGKSVGRNDYQVFADLPIIAKWKESMAGNLPSVRIVNWMEQTFTPGKETVSKISLNRREFSSSYAYSAQYQKEIDTLIRKFQTDGIGCNLMKRINFWISPELVPDSLIVSFLPSKPEIRILNQYLFVDTGILRAGRLDQLENQLLGIVFQANMQLHGKNIATEVGDSAVANSIRVLMNEGVISYIENRPGTIFAKDHPALGKINLVPEQIYGFGIRAIELYNLHLPDMLEDEALMEKKGAMLVKSLVASNSLNQGGFTMSATIAANLGDEALRATVGSPSAWLAAYQKAAKMNPIPAPKPYLVMDQLHLSMPPFDDSVYEGLQNILKQTFESP